MELLIEFYVREILSILIKIAVSTKIKSYIVHLYNELEFYLKSLKFIGMTSDKYSTMLLLLVRFYIPGELLRVQLSNRVSST